MLLRRRRLIKEEVEPIEYLKDDAIVLEIFLMLRHYFGVYTPTRFSDWPYPPEKIIELAKKYNLPTEKGLEEHTWSFASGKDENALLNNASNLLLSIAFLPRDIQQNLHADLLNKTIFNRYYAGGKRAGDEVKTKTWFKWIRGNALERIYKHAIEKYPLFKTSRETGVDLDI